MAEHKVQQYKVEAVQKLKDWFAESPDLIFSDFRGLTFPQMTDLRAKLGERKTLYRVVRNAFAKIALKESGLPDASAMLEGPTALAFLGSRPGTRGEGARRVHEGHAPEGEGRDHRRTPLQRERGRGAVAPAEPGRAARHAPGDHERAAHGPHVRDERRGLQAGSDPRRRGGAEGEAAAA